MSILADALEPLVNVWNAIALDADAVFEMASSWQLNSKVYYEVRAMRPPGEIERAAQFMYLNKGAFNGLWRVNSSGGFNVPWGRPKSQFMGDVENIRRVSELTRASAGVVRHADFAQIIRLAKSGDLLFLDPPYVTTKSAGSFIHYNDRVFAWDDQVRLAESAKLAVARGVKVLATNAFHPAIRDLWGGFAHFELTRQSTMAAGSAKRGRVSESLFVSR
ncbi:Dam family site-specific DNA-(adenine-N6)-methyltransferase [soil metagenome]